LIDLDRQLDHELALFVLFVVFLILNILDVFSTLVGIAMHGFIELNPVGAYLISKIGLLPAMIVQKSLFISLIGASIALVVKETPSSFLDDDVLLGGMAFLNVLGLFVLSNNFGLLGWPFFFQFRF
jgi:uncharacterized membrane protein